MHFFGRRAEELVGCDRRIRFFTSEAVERRHVAACVKSACRAGRACSPALRAFSLRTRSSTSMSARKFTIFSAAVSCAVPTCGLIIFIGCLSMFPHKQNGLESEPSEVSCSHVSADRSLWSKLIERPKSDLAGPHWCIRIQHLAASGQTNQWASRRRMRLARRLFPTGTCR